MIGKNSYGRQYSSATPQPAQLQPENGFLPAEQWGWIQEFNKAMAD